MSSNQVHSYKETIENCFPNLNVDSICLLGEGKDNVVVSVNDDLVFRFPKGEESASMIELEAAVLPELQKRLDVPIPSPKFVGTDPSTGLIFAGYRWIRGVALEPEVLFDLDPQVQTSLTEQIARFLRQLHSYSVEEATKLGLRVNDFKVDYTGDLQRIRELLLPRLERRERECVERLYVEYLEDPGNFDYEPTVIHADLSPNHILYDPATQVITGIIDFGDMVIGDPDYELTYLYERYGERFLQGYLAFNPHPSPDRLLRKLRFFYRADAVGNIVHGLCRDGSEATEGRVVALRPQPREAPQCGAGGGR